MAENTLKSEKVSSAKPTSTWKYVKYGLVAISVIGLGFLGYKALKKGPVDPNEVAESI